MNFNADDLDFYAKFVDIGQLTFLTLALSFYYDSGPAGTDSLSDLASGIWLWYLLAPLPIFIIDPLMVSRVGVAFSPSLTSTSLSLSLSLSSSQPLPSPLPYPG